MLGRPFITSQQFFCKSNASGINNIHKRNFWKIKELEANVYIRNIGQTGVFFTHNNIGCSLTEFMTNSSSTNFSWSGQTVTLPSDSVANSFNLSLDKLPTQDREYIVNKMNENKPIRVTFETHIIGNPKKGFCLKPHYLKKIIN